MSLPRRRVRSLKPSLILFAIMMFASRAASAGSLTLAWDPSPEADIAGYLVFYGTASGAYTNSIDVGNVTAFAVAGLTVGQQYFLAVRAYNVSGLQSALSAEASAIVPSGIVPAVVARVTVSPTTATVNSGASTTLTAQAFDASNVALSGVAFAWTSSNTSVASLSAPSGQVVSATGSSAGSSVVTVSAGGLSATSTITVNAVVARVTVSPATATLKAGETTNLTAQAFDSSNNPLPSVALTWSTANSAVASISTTTGATNTITGVGVGTTTVRVTDSSGTLSATSAITVNPQPTVSRVAITPATASLVPAQRQQFVAIAFDSTNTAIAGVPFTWTTTSSTIAPLSVTSGSTVTVTPQTAGSATLTATATTNGTVARATITVTPQTTTRVIVTPPTTVGLGWRQTLAAQAVDSNGNAVPSASFTWTTSNAAVARLVSTSGGSIAIVGYGLGTAVVTATEAGGLTATTTITVTAGDTLVWDTFTGATGSSLTAHAPDSNMTGSAWSTSGSAQPTLQSGLARVTTIGSASSVVAATMSAGTPDVRVATDWRAQSTTAWGGVIVRWTDASNFIFAGYRNSSEVAVFRVQSGTWTRLVGAPVTVTSGTTHQLEAVTAGALIQVYWDGGLLLQTSDAFNQSVASHGLAWSNGVDTASGYDTFRLTGSLAPPSPTPPPAPPPPDPGPPPPAPDPTPAPDPLEPNTPSRLTAVVDGAAVVLRWAAPTVLPTASYVIEAGSVSGSSDQASFDTGNPSVTYVASAVPPATYYVRVRAHGADGQIGAASNEVIARVGASALVCSATAGTPGLLTATVVGSTVRLDWQGSSDASSYVVEAGSAPGASNLANIDTQSPATSFIANGVGAGTYFVRVRSRGGCGVASAATNELAITVDQ
jgi:uncharacterized protein YjdB